MQNSGNRRDSLTVIAFAFAANVHPITVDRKIRDGSLRFEWDRGRRLISRDQLPAFIESVGRRRTHNETPSSEAVAP